MDRSIVPQMMGWSQKGLRIFNSTPVSKIFCRSPTTNLILSEIFKFLSTDSALIAKILKDRLLTL